MPPHPSTETSGRSHSQLAPPLLPRHQHPATWLGCQPRRLQGRRGALLVSSDPQASQRGSWGLASLTSLQPYLPGVLGTSPSSRLPTWGRTLDLSRPPDSDTHFPTQPHCRASAQHTQSRTPGFLSLHPLPSRLSLHPSAAALGPVSSRPLARDRSPEPVWVLHTSKTCHSAFKTCPASDTCHLPRHPAARPSSASLGSSQRGLGKTGPEPPPLPSL